MITLVTDISQTDGFDDVFGVKIRSSVLAYGLDKTFLLTWVQSDGKAATALIQKQDNAVTISAKDTDFDELEQFLNVIGFGSVFAEKSVAQRLNLTAKSVGAIMKYSSSCPKKTFAKVPQPKFKAIYNLLCGCGFDMPEFEPFYLDLSHRVRHSTVRIFADENYSAVAFTAWETENAAVISAVAVRENERRKGLGSLVLQSLIAELEAENKQIYLYRAQNENEAFYLKNGMINCGEFAAI